MYVSLNESKSRRFSYYFDERLVGKTQKHRSLVRRVALFITLGVLSLSWVPVERLLHERSFFTRTQEKDRFMADLRSNLADVQHIHQVISKNTVGLSRKTQWQLAEVIQMSAERYDMDPYLILAVIKTESGFNTRAVSNANAQGLMQILPPVGQELAERLRIPFQPGVTLFDPVANVRLGTYFLSELLRRFNGDLELTLLAYNRGPNDVERALSQAQSVPAHYSEKVLAFQELFRRERDRRFGRKFREVVDRRAAQQDPTSL